MNAGATAQHIRELPEWEDSDLFSEEERLAIELAERMTESDRDVSEEFFRTLQRHFGDRGIVELTAALAIENLLSKFNRVFRIASQGFCELPTALDEPSD